MRFIRIVFFLAILFAVSQMSGTDGLRPDAFERAYLDSLVVRLSEARDFSDQSDASWQADAANTLLEASALYGIEEYYEAALLYAYRLAVHINQNSTVAGGGLIHTFSGTAASLNLQLAEATLLLNIGGDYLPYANALLDAVSSYAIEVSGN